MEAENLAKTSSENGESDSDSAAAMASEQQLSGSVLLFAL